MNKEQMMDAVGQVEDSLLEEATLPAQPVKLTRQPWFKPLAAAACCVLVVGTLLNGGLFRMGSAKYAASSSAMAAGGTMEEAAMDMGSIEGNGWIGSYGISDSVVAESPAEAPAPMPTDGPMEPVTEYTKAKSENDRSISRKIIYTAGMTLESTEFDRALAELQQTVSAMGGYVESCDQGGESKYSNRWYSACLRIPTESYHQFLDGAQQIASTTYLSQSTRDITLDYVDTQARIDSLKTQRDRLDELAAKAETVEDLIYIQGQLSDVEYRLESYASQLRVMDNQVSLSTVNLDLHEVQVETPVENRFGQRMSFAFATGWNNFVDSLQDILLGISFDWPWFLLLGIVSFTAAVLWKKRKKK